MESITHKKTTNNFIVLEVIDARTIKLVLKHPPKATVIDAATKEIVSVEVDDGYDIQVNTTAISTKISNKDMIYKVKGIKDLGDNKFLLYTNLKSNKTSYFLSPILGISKEDMYYNRYLVNAFLSDSTIKNKNREIWLLYRYFPNTPFKLMEKFMIKHPKFSSVIDIDFNFIILAFSLTDLEYQQVELFLKGKYSQLDNKLKANILKFHGLDRNSITADILYKSERRRKQLELELDASIDSTIELYEKPIIYNEIFVLNRDTNANISTYKILEI